MKLGVSFKAIVGLCLGFFLYGIWWFDCIYFPIQNVHITGEMSHTSKNDLKNLIQQHVEKGYLKMSVHALKKDIAKLEWMESVDVRRVWPDSVQVQIVEKVPLAYFGEKGLISTQGVVFYPTKKITSLNLPTITGPRDFLQMLIQCYSDMYELLLPYGVGVESVVLDMNNSIVCELDNGLKVVLGEIDPVERMKKFVQAYKSHLCNHAAKISYIDMRYPNGLAIGWKENIRHKPDIGDLFITS